ncbi:YpjP family protein [Lentibacillus saliphilus]|uniref:YpjP family protein n=1 Tax=Lentibacillus saliphilus TaxID=2737028 RepID=UPI001C304A8A|nr:YpjP family protein [Lentibacillus saliphilus]
MKRWMQKIFVALIAVLTLGLYIPQSPLTVDHDEHKGEVSSKTGSEKSVRANHIEDAGHTAQALPRTESTEALQPTSGLQDANELFARSIVNEAKTQTITKLGPKIADRIDLDFTTDILPKIEEVLDGLLQEAGTENIPYYSITEQPTGGLGEMIFNVYDERTKEDIARFHVRRDNRPQEGYWFNFHYHLQDDNFENHHTIGDVYWDKNTPPNWMA